MKKRLLPVAILATVVTAIGANAAKDSSRIADPTVMKVNGKEVKLSEFEYLYNKNNSQQIAPTSVDDYVDMFVTYKLKVADAEAAGIDTTRSFLTEFYRYRNELAEPYLTDSNVEDSLVREIYDHFKTNRDVNYIMMFGGRTPEEKEANRQRIDSVRTAILEGADFGVMADRFSVDRNHGHMGYLKPNRFPYDFEKAVYDTPIGQLSDVKQLNDFGYFLVRVDSEHPDPGQVLARHILKITRGVSPEEKAVKKAQIDSIFNLLQSGGDFEAIAIAESEDPGSAKNGGMLPWFGTGEMVRPFEEATFALANGQISEPVETSYGYHIIQRLDHRDLGPIEDFKEKIAENIKRDSRAKMASNKRLQEFRKDYKATVNAKTLKEIKKIIAKAGGVDSTLMASLQENKKIVATVGDQKVTVGEVAKAMKLSHDINAEKDYKRFEETTERLLDEATREYAITLLPSQHPEYNDLINEYRDGMLLFEVSNRNVWDKATRDKKGLETYFLTHRNNYTWDKPRYKGDVIFANNDSIMNLVKEFVAEKPDLSHENLVKELHRKFNKKVKIERVLAAKGENAIIDYLAFDGPEAQFTQVWPCAITYGGVIIDQPQEAADVRGAVTADYQQVLENSWTELLRKKYPVEIYYDVINQAKPSLIKK